MAPFQNTSRGYDVVATQLQGTPPRPNAYLRFIGGSDGPSSVNLWCYELTTGFQQAGSTGQSYRTRSFFPRSFVQPAFTIFCQAPNQKIYGDTVEFIRMTQRSMESSTIFDLVSRSRYTGHNLKGAHEGNSAEGYVKSIQRVHNRYEYAPTFQFDFIVERYLAPARWRDQRNQAVQVLPTWKEVIESQKAGFATTPDPEIDQATLDSPLFSPGPNGQNRPN